MSSPQNDIQIALDILGEYRELVWKELKQYLKDPTYPKEFPIPSQYKDEHDMYWEMVKDYP